GVREGGGDVPGVGVQPQRSAVSQAEGPEVHPRQELPILARKRPADASHDSDVQDERENRGHQSVEKRRHGRALRRMSATRGATKVAEQRSWTTSLVSPVFAVLGTGITDRL